MSLNLPFPSAGWFDTSAKLNVNIDKAARFLVDKILEHQDIFQKKKAAEVGDIAVLNVLMCPLQFVVKVLADLFVFFTLLSFPSDVLSSGCFSAGCGREDCQACWLLLAPGANSALERSVHSTQFEQRM